MFYKTGVDITKEKSMWHFLKNHFTYSTMNSWNGMKSIAHNVKLYNLKLDGDWTVALQFLHDEMDTGCLQMFIDDEIREFSRENPGYVVGFNGRSGGYLVLYNSDNYRTVLPDCVEQYDTYEDFKLDCKDYGYRISDYYRELREVTLVVREFDKLCDRIRDLVNGYSTRSFSDSKLEEVVERFYNEYGDDLEELGLEGPEYLSGKIKLNDVADYKSLLFCLMFFFGSDAQKIETDNIYIWLED